MDRGLDDVTPSPAGWTGWGGLWKDQRGDTFGPTPPFFCFYVQIFCFYVQIGFNLVASMYVVVGLRRPRRIRAMPLEAGLPDRVFHPVDEAVQGNRTPGFSLED